MSQPDFAPAYQLSGGQDPDEPRPLPTDEDVPPIPPAEADAPQPGASEPPAAPEPAVEDKAAARSAAALAAKVTMLSERLRAQETATASLQSGVERIESTVGDLTKRAQPMLETLSAELARQGAMLEGLRTDLESGLEMHAQRVAEFEQRLAGVLREMRELVGGKLESYDIALADKLEEAHHAVGDKLAGFQDQVEELVRRYAGEAIPEEMRTTVEELSSRFVYAETALAATRSSVEFLRSEVGSLTMIVRKLSPGGGQG